MKTLVVICAGRHGATALPILRNSYRIVGFIDDWPQARLGDLPHLGPLSHIERLRPEVDCAWIGLGGLQTLDLRQRLFLKAQRLGFSMASAIHSQAYCCSTARHGAGLFLAPFSLVHANAQVGDNVCIYSGSVVEHDCCISDHVFLGPGVHTAGAVHIETGAYLSLGVKVGYGLRVGASSLVAAGSVVIDNIPAGQVALGVPARIWGSVEEWHERKRLVQG